MEEFLELTKNATRHCNFSHKYAEKIDVSTEVSISTLLELTQVLRKRIPSRHLPKLDVNEFIQHIRLCAWMKNTYLYTAALFRKNLRELTSLQIGDEKNGAAKFWRWLDNQKWRRMLPHPKEKLGTLVYLSKVNSKNIGSVLFVLDLEDRCGYDGPKLGATVSYHQVAYVFACRCAPLIANFCDIKVCCLSHHNSCNPMTMVPSNVSVLSRRKGFTACTPMTSSFSVPDLWGLLGQLGTNLS